MHKKFWVKGQPSQIHRQLPTDTWQAPSQQRRAPCMQPCTCYSKEQPLQISCQAQKLNHTPKWMPTTAHAQQQPAVTPR